jgi:hypothetical protein
VQEPPEPEYEIVTPEVTPDEYGGTVPVSVVPVTASPPVTTMLVAGWVLKVQVFMVQALVKLPPDSVNAIFPLSGAFLG